jgi:hypothetical protein
MNICMSNDMHGSSKLNFQSLGGKPSHGAPY